MGKIKQSQAEILELMALNEEKIGKLYLHYSKKFPKLEKFWLDLYQEEKDHSLWIRTLAQGVGKTRGLFFKERFTPESIKSFLAYLDTEIGKAGQEEITLTKALSISLHIETSLVENRFFESFADNSPEIKELFNNLTEATLEHQEKIKKAWYFEKAKSY